MDIYQKTTEFYKLQSCEKRIIGKSYFGRDIYALKIGDGSPVGICQYAIHGREYITTELAFFHFKRGVYKGSLWILPLTNPDGALLSQIGIRTVPKKDRATLIKINGGDNFSLWKANGRGVDLNTNFDADWGKGVQNITFPASENYIGKAPFSESETLALKHFTEEINPDYTVSYHTKGEEIYWYFSQSTRTCPRDKRLGEVLSTATGYPLRLIKGSVGGYKDWCIRKFKIPSFTVEAGKDSFSHPLTKTALSDIIAKNENALYVLSKEV